MCRHDGLPLKINAKVGRPESAINWKLTIKHTWLKRLASRCNEKPVSGVFSSMKLHCRAMMRMKKKKKEKEKLSFMSTRKVN
jgi:hypothetical protein